MGHPGMKQLAFVCSPLRATRSKTMEQHLADAEEYGNIVRAEGDIPVIPHLWLQGPLDDTDPRQRELGMAMGRAALLQCDEIQVWGERISDGMAQEIKLARAHSIPVRRRLMREAEEAMS